jgi:hypothetical protein
MPNKQLETMRKSMEDYREASQPFQARAKSALSDPVLKGNDPDRWEAIKGKVLDLRANLEQQELDYERAFIQNQQQIFADLQKPEGAGFRVIKSKTYVPSYGIPGAKESYDKVTYKRSKDTDKTVQTKLAEGLGVDPEFINMNRNIQNDALTGAKVFDTPDEMAQYLSAPQDIEEVHPIKIGGEDNFLIKDISTGVRRSDDKVVKNESYYLAFKPGSDKGRKFMAGSISVVPRIGAAVLGASKVLGAAGPSQTIAGGAGRFTGGSLASSGGYEGVKGAQESLSRIWGNMDQNLGERAVESAIDTGLNLGADALLAGGGRVITKTAAKPVINELQDGLQGAKETFEKKTGEVIDDFPHVSGKAATREQFGRLSRFEGTSFGKRVKRLKESFGRVQKGLLGEGSTLAQRKELVDVLQSEYDEVAEELLKQKARGKKVGGGAIQKAIDRRKSALGVGKAPMAHQLGEDILPELSKAQQAGRELTEKAYGGWHQAADGKGQAKAEMIDAIDGVLRKKENAGLDSSTVQELKDRIMATGGDGVAHLDSYGLKNMVETAGDTLSPSGVKGMTGKSTDARLTAQIREALVGVRDNFNKKNGLNPAWKNATDTYQAADLAFKQGSPGYALADDLVGKKNSPAGVVKRLLRDGKTVDDYMAAMYATGNGAQAEARRRQLKDVFVEGMGTSGINKSRDVVDSLWGRLPDGSIDAAKSQRAFEALQDIQALSKKAGKGLSKKSVNVTVDEVEALAGYIGTKERNKLLGNIAVRQAQQEAEDAVLRNSIIKKAKDSGWDYGSTDELARSLWDAPKKDLDQIFASTKISPSTKLAIKQDMRNQFFSEYASPSGINEFAPGQELFNAQRVMDEVGSWKGRGKGPLPRIVEKLDAIGDKETTDLVISMARIQKEVAPPVGATWDGPKLKFIVDQTGKSRGWLSEGLGTIKDYGLAHAYGTPGFKSAMRLMLKNTDPREVEKSLNKVYRNAIFSRLGMEHAVRRSSQDPQFAEDFQNMLAEIAREEAAK